jgi:hypothetical protein
MKYRKKPIVLEAFQMTDKTRWDNSDWPAWLHKAWNDEPGEGAMWIDPEDPQRALLLIGTKEGVHRVSWGDFIIQGVQGELYPCKPDIFAMTYEEATDATEDRETAERLKAAGWVGDTYWMIFKNGDIVQKSLTQRCDFWLPAPTISELQGDLIWDDFKGFFRAHVIHSNDLGDFWPKFARWLDSTHRSANALAEVLEWKLKKGREAK